MRVEVVYLMFSIFLTLAVGWQAGLVMLAFTLLRMFMVWLVSDTKEDR